MSRQKLKVDFVKPKNMDLSVVEYKIKDLFKNSGKGKVFKLAVIPDVHFPDHDETAVGILLKFLKDYKPNGILFLGDFWEMEEVTRWDRESNNLSNSLKTIKAGADFIKNKILKAAGPQCKTKIFLMGNHEDWFRQYIADMDKYCPDKVDLLKQLYGSDKFEDICGLSDMGFDVHPYISDQNSCSMIKIGHAHYTHGYLAGVNPAKKLFMEVLACAYQGHTERLDTYRHKSISGNKEAMTLGTLRDQSKVNFNRGRMLGWNHSFSTFEFFDDGMFSRQTYHIINGRLARDGKIYD